MDAWPPGRCPVPSRCRAGTSPPAWWTRTPTPPWGRVAAHVTTDAVTRLVRAGVDSVEHGTALEESTLRLMARAGTAWTPTLCAVLAVPGTASEAARRRVAG